ncbi:hypothetical protein [Streptomyces spororaveus]|nr:hypothetical protein [Streptomyces spororaveus]
MSTERFDEALRKWMDRGGEAWADPMETDAELKRTFKEYKEGLRRAARSEELRRKRDMEFAAQEEVQRQERRQRKDRGDELRDRMKQALIRLRGSSHRKPD